MTASFLATNVVSPHKTVTCACSQADHSVRERGVGGEEMRVTSHQTDITSDRYRPCAPGQLTARTGPPIRRPGHGRADAEPAGTRASARGTAGRGGRPARHGPLPTGRPAGLTSAPWST
ncbi:hypothetical protein GCM10023347_43410 [Streptomyces chumphonensis]